jgi:hypothetical protein
MGKDYRAPISAAEFNNAPDDDDEFALDWYYENLVDGNSKFRGLGAEFTRGYEDIRFIKQLTRGQQLLILLGIFDGQVCNGGIVQFFWNYPEYIFDVRDAVDFIGDERLLAEYDKALEALVGYKDNWVQLREQLGTQNGPRPQLETLQKIDDVVHLDWFDTLYYDTRAYNAEGELVVVARGLNYEMITRLIQYIKTHKSELISGKV